MPSYQDIHLIAPMLEHLGFMPNPARRVNPSDDDLLGRDPQKYHFYRCKHFNAKAKLCTIYEIRPAMCREYPYGEPCKYDACTWEEKKEKKQTPKERRERLRILKESEVRASDPGGGEKQYAAKSELAEKIGELNGKQKAELAELLGLGPKKRKRGLGRGMAALLPQKAKGR